MIRLKLVMTIKSYKLHVFYVIDAFFRLSSPLCAYFPQASELALQIDINREIIVIKPGYL